MPDLNIPPFLLGTMSWVHHGYFFAADPPQDLDELASRNGPFLFAHVLQEAKRGHLEALTRLRRWFRQPFEEGWSHAAVTLFGDAGGLPELEMIAELLENGPQELLIRTSDVACMAG